MTADLFAAPPMSAAPPWQGSGPEDGALTIWDATPLDHPTVPPEVAPPRPELLPVRSYRPPGGFRG